MQNKYTNKKVAILELGIEGKDAVNFLLSVGSRITVLDKKQESEIDFSGIPKNKIEIVCGKDYLNDLEDFDFLVRSPGIYRYLPEIVKAEKKGVIVTSSINIFMENCSAKVIGVTGTKGKGTTSTLIYEILKSAKFDVYLSGNIGKPYLELLPKITQKSWIVMEMSSFQLIDLQTSPHISVVLNITSDHMDWHKSQAEYISAKKNVVKYQTPADWSVINKEYETPLSFAKITKGSVIYFSKKILDEDYKKDITLRGEHNLENIAAAVAVSKILNIQKKVIIDVVKNFKGLEHRLEFIREINGIKFYNDSFATGPQPTIAAIKSFTEPETLILGGSDKGLDYKELSGFINKTKNIKNIILIGTTGPKIEKYLKKNLKFKICNLGFASMIRIVKKAFQITSPDGVVVLSPASASFDMFKDYKDRGNQFKEAVEGLK